MIQPSLFTADRPASVSRKRGQVIASSVEAYQQIASKDERAAMVVRLLTSWPYGEAPTSAELAQTYYGPEGWDDTRWKLWIRRGLSDAKNRGLVEHAGKIQCPIEGTTAIAWKVKSR